MMPHEWNRAWTTVTLVVGLLGLCLVTAGTPAHAHSSDWAAPFMGGIMAGHVLSNIQQQRERQTQAMEEMARGGGGYGGYGARYGGGGFAGYGGGYGRPAYGPPPQPAYGPPPQYGAPAGCR